MVAHDVGVLMQSGADLLEIGLALSTSDTFSCCLNRWQQQRHHEADDGDHRQKFDEGETSMSAWKSADNQQAQAANDAIFLS